MKKSWLAALLNVIPGVGYIYLDITRPLGWLLLGGTVSFVVTFFDPSNNLPGPTPQGIWNLWYATLLLLPYAGFILDGYMEGERMNEKVHGSSDPKARGASISLVKFVFLNVITLGAYQVYWGWKAWETVRRANGEVYKFPSSLRSIFIGLSCLKLFPHVYELAKSKGYKSKLNGEDVAAIYFLINTLAFSAFRFIASLPVILILEVSIPIVMALSLLPVVRALNYYNRETHSDHAPTKANVWLILALAALYGTGIIAGMFIGLNS